MQEYNYNKGTIMGDPIERTGHFGVKYRGISYVKCPFDYVLYQMLIEETKPDLVIEIGTFLGGGALYIADIMERLNKGVVHTIDISINEYDPLVTENPRIKMFSAGYQGYDLSNTIGFEKILIIDDGSHVYDDVMSAFTKFSHLVTSGSYYIIEDGTIEYSDVYHNGGPHKAITEIIKDSKKFIIDREWCDFFGKNSTFNPDGYLKRL